MATFQIRPVTEDELPAFETVDQHAFNGRPDTARQRANWHARLELDPRSRCSSFRVETPAWHSAMWQRFTEKTRRVVFYAQNRRDSPEPGQPPIDFPGVSILHYAGDGKWSGGTSSTQLQYSRSSRFAHRRPDCNGR